MAGLLRYQLFLSIFILFLSLWKTSLTNASTIQRYSPFPSSTTEVIITYLPLWALICLGMYALSCVLYKVVTFEDCAGASLELGREIEIAKEKLKSRGFEFWKKMGEHSCQTFWDAKYNVFFLAEQWADYSWLFNRKIRNIPGRHVLYCQVDGTLGNKTIKHQTTYYQSCLCSCIFCKIYWAIIDQKSVLKQFF